VQFGVVLRSQPRLAPLSAVVSREVDDLTEITTGLHRLRATAKATTNTSTFTERLHDNYDEMSANLVVNYFLQNLNICFFLICLYILNSSDYYYYYY
jgi:hypothetical protein